MKLTGVIVILLTICVNDCQLTSRVRRSFYIFDAVVNKTQQITGYVKEKGRSLKDFYKENIANKISSYFGDGNNETNIVEDIETTITNKFKYYIDKAENISSTVYETIASAPIKFKCDEDAVINRMTTTQLVTFHGYVSESHTIVTDDGYVLTVHRIPFSKKSSKKVSPKRTVLLHHGLLGSSADWVIPGPNKGLAYILANAGYDVWMSNVRGNVYSRAHVNRNTDSQAFWNFTFHEVSQYDLPATIEYIIGKKGADVKINYVGFSMGTTVLFALLSTKMKYNDVLRAGFALAPVAYMKNIKSPMKVIAKYDNNIDSMIKLFGANEFLPRNAIMRYISQHSCKISNFEEVICTVTMFTLCGHDKLQFDRSLVPLIYGHVPAGASTKTLVHYSQEINDKGRFQQFDYGVEGNLKQYGTATPPEYPVHKITLPIALISGEDDWLSSVSDASELYRRLANPIEHYVIPMKDFNHLNFLFAKDAPTLVYDKLLQLLETSY